MRFVFSMLLLSLFTLTGMAWAANPDAGCVQKCEKQKKSCMAQYTKSDSRSGTYVTPDGHKICWQGFHDCKNQCPKKKGK